MYSLLDINLMLPKPNKDLIMDFLKCVVLLSVIAVLLSVIAVALTMGAELIASAMAV